MAELTSRRDHWTDVLPESWRHNMNTNPLLNALGRAMNRKTPDLGALAMSEYGTPEQQEKADQDWLLQKMHGPKLNPLAAEMLDKGGMLANFLGPGVKLPPMAPKPTGIRAYHGSPHDFDRFDMSKIGTGEGAQAYGRGLYFSESPAVARSYEGMLAGNGYDPAVIARDALEAAGRDPVKALSILEKNIPPKMGLPEMDILTENYGHATDILRRHAAGAKMPLPARGRMYEVNIKADPDQFLDWDKPLYKQTKAFDALYPNGYFGSRASVTDEPAGNILARGVGQLSKDDVSSVLRDAGIPGIKYLDQGSRTAGQGSRNYVVFDDKLIEILRKYGLLPPAAVGAASLANQPQEPPL